jgi:2'-5' RNA ligase
MSVIRAFIAIPLPSDIQRQIQQVSDHLRARLPGVAVRWVPVENIHLTLKFLGDVSLGNLEILKNMLQLEVSNHSAFEFSVGEVGAFPTPRRPRVIWVGVEAPVELHQLQHGIEAETSRLGYQPEERAFSPHLTLGRVSRNATPNDLHQIGDVLSNYKVGYLGAVRVLKIELFKSDLQPAGAVYTKLFSASLKEK